MFCDLVGSTPLAEKLDPEELREVVQEYQVVCEEVIHRFGGYIARYVGDALLVYFGYPHAHEDDSQRAVRARLEIVAALPPLNARLQQRAAVLQTSPLQVRIGIHTGLAVVGEMGGNDYREAMALGETPNIAARLQGLAEPDTVVISVATSRLTEGLFECHNLGPQTLKGVTVPLTAYRVLRESGVQSRFEVAVTTGLTPLVGREEEVKLLWQRWEQTKDGHGQVILLSGEAGIGKSRLVRVLKERTAEETQTWLECRCSPYHQNSAFYPLIDLLQRVLRFSRDDSPEEKLRKLEAALEVGAIHESPQRSESIPLFAALLSLPLPEHYPPLNLTPQRQKQKTLEAVLTWLLAEAEQHPLPFIVEDPQWADPSTLEVLGLLIEQVPTARLLVILAFRPEFTPPWAPRSHMIHLTLQRLPRKQVHEMVSLVVAQNSRPSTSSGRAESISSGEEQSVRAEPVEARTALRSEIVQQIVAKTDGVPLFVEELTKTVLESRESIGSLESVGSAIPATLQDSLMARLDRLGSAKELAQLGATLGREFSYELFHAVSPIDEAALQQGLRQLVEAELLYQRGLPPQATYLFKHALIQDVAYQSLLKSTRQQYHQQIAQVLEERFSEIKETQPELLAHHYTEAGLITQAIPYWQQAGERATQRSAYVEAISHLTQGLELLKTVPDTPDRAQQELALQLALGMALVATKGFAALEGGKIFARARELCQRVGETPQLFGVLMGLWVFYLNRAEHKTAHELAEQCLRLAQSMQDSYSFVQAHGFKGLTLFNMGEFALAYDHLEQGIALYDPQQHSVLSFGTDTRTVYLSMAALTLWSLGYPDQARKKSHEALTLAQEVSHPLGLANTLLANAALLHLLRWEVQVIQERAEAMVALSSEQGFAQYLAYGLILRGWALAAQGQEGEGIAQLCQGLAAYRAIGAELWRPYCLVLLAEAYRNVGQTEEGFAALADALTQVEKTGERWYEAELYRLYGELSLRIGDTEAGRIGDTEKEPENRRAGEPENGREDFSFTDSPIRRFSVSSSEIPRFPVSSPEACFHKAIEIARKQQAKSLELRATMSLARLWQSQGKKEEAHRVLAEIYGWFTEGFDTADLREAKALLTELEDELLISGSGKST